MAIQLNDTHPAIAIPELMRLLMDEEGWYGTTAWPICEKTFAYTNHTVLPEALETWPVDLIQRILPRHMEIIFEINRRFLAMVSNAGKKRTAACGKRVSLIVEGGQQRVRMAHLAIVGSHTVNGVAELHSKIIKEELFKDFDTLFPGRLTNVTNGITPRRWLAQANPPLAKLINDTIGPGMDHRPGPAAGTGTAGRRCRISPRAGSKPSGTTKNGWHAISCEKSVWASTRTRCFPCRSSASMSTSVSCSTCST